MVKLVNIFLYTLVLISIGYWIPRIAGPSEKLIEPPIDVKPSILNRSFPIDQVFRSYSPNLEPANITLQGIIFSDSIPRESIVILKIDNSPTKFLRVDEVIEKGIRVKQINEKTVIISERGLERTLTLPLLEKIL